VSAERRRSLCRRIGVGDWLRDGRAVLPAMHHLVIPSKVLSELRHAESLWQFAIVALPLVFSLGFRYRLPLHVFGRIDPDAGERLYKAISYLLKYWDRLTLLLRQPGAPLGNNICERALKKSILHRKNSLFYKTRNGARIGDLFMSLIHTCELNGADPFDYLNQLQRHAEELKLTPSEWMPWNYRATLARTGALVDAV
jgi:hypothetical protein